MTVRDVWQSVVAFYEPTLEILQLWAWGLPLFAVVVGATLLLAGSPRARTHPKSLPGMIFPKEMYRHASGSVDR